MGVLARIAEGVDKDEENYDSNVWRRKEWANRYRVDVSFDGACFCGWQTWKNSAGQNKTAHHHVQLVLRTVLRAADLALVSAGRTDAGVHVLCMPCHFDLPDSETHDAGFLKSAMVVRTIYTTKFEESGELLVLTLREYAAKQQNAAARTAHHATPPRCAALACTILQPRKNVPV